MGLATQMVQLMESIATATQMHRVVCTVFVFNTVSQAFFRRAGYVLDVTDCSDDPDIDYNILSKSVVKA
jgi:RimJ/RimL family protein N-acetyltransferase